MMYRKNRLKNDLFKRLLKSINTRVKCGININNLFAVVLFTNALCQYFRQFLSQTITQKSVFLNTQFMSFPLVLSTCPPDYDYLYGFDLTVIKSLLLFNPLDTPHQTMFELTRLFTYVVKNVQFAI